MNAQTTKLASTLTAAQFVDLAKVKAGMTLDHNILTIGGQEIELSQKILTRAVVEGIYRQLSAETAKLAEDKKADGAVKIIERFIEGYWTESEKKAATKTVIEKTGGKAPKYGRLELMQEFRAITPKKDLPALEEKLAIINEYSDDKFALFLSTQAAKKGSLVSKAIESLNKKAEAKAAKELEKLTADLIDL